MIKQIWNAEIRAMTGLQLGSQHIFLSWQITGSASYTGLGSDFLHLQCGVHLGPINLTTALYNSRYLYNVRLGTNTYSQ